MTGLAEALNDAQAVSDASTDVESALSRMATKAEGPYAVSFLPQPPA
jgi:hypothetical protein